MPFIGTTPTQGFVSAVTKQSFTPNGSTTAFTLSHSVSNENDLEVFVGNVRQEPTAAYSASGTTLTMTEAPDSGLNFYVIFKNKAQVTTTPPDGSVGTAKLDANAVTTAKIANSAITDSKIAALSASKLTGALPAISGASLTGISAGIEMVDQWRLTTTFTGNQNPITSNWERNDTTGYGALGSAMSNSSGTFTFPTTGVYHIGFHALVGSAFSSGAHSQGCWIYIRTTTNNSSYTDAAIAQQGIYNFNTSYFSGGSEYCETVFDVTDVSTHKVQFGYGAGQGGEACRGSSSSQATGFTITRLGDT